MSKKQLALIAFTCLVLFAIFIILDKQEKEGVIVDQSKVLFADLKSEAIAKVNLGTKENTIELELQNGTWGVASRNAYPADVNHVRSLLLNVLDLNVSQKITSNKERYAALGVDDENFKDQLTFFTADNKPLGGLLLGKDREIAVDGEPSAPAGQYVRRVGEQDVFLAAQKIDLQKDAFYWLDANLSNFLASKLVSLKQYALKDSTETLSIELQADKEANFKLVSKVLAEKESLNPAAVSKITSALENARLQDVYRNDDQKVSGLVFDLKNVYQGKDGLVYTVLTVENDKKYYAQFKVEFDPTLVDQQAAEATATPALTPDASATAAAQVASPVPSEKLAEAASAEQAKTLNDRYSKWIYELPEYQAKKFRVAIEELVQVVEPEDAPEAVVEKAVAK